MGAKGFFRLCLDSCKMLNLAFNLKHDDLHACRTRVGWSPCWFFRSQRRHAEQKFASSVSPETAHVYRWAAELPAHIFIILRQSACRFGKNARRPNLGLQIGPVDLLAGKNAGNLAGPRGVNGCEALRSLACNFDCYAPDWRGKTKPNSSQ